MQLSMEAFLVFFMITILLWTKPGLCMENGDGHFPTCTLQLKTASIPEEIDKFIQNNLQLLHYNFNVDKDNGPYSPTSTEQHDLLKPYSMVLALDPVGKSLLNLKENFVPMSLYTLGYGVAWIEVDLIQSPHDCLTGMQATDLETELKLLVFRNFGNLTSSPISEGEICNQHVHATEEGTGIVKYSCCKFAVGDYLECLDLDETVWLNMLFKTIIIVQVVLVLYSPTFIPIGSTMDKCKEYIYKPTKHMELKVLKLKNTAQLDNIKNDFVQGSLPTLTLESLKNKLRNLLNLPDNKDRQAYSLTVRKVNFVVRANTLLPGSPIAFVKFLKDFFLQLQMRNDLPELGHCCNTNIFNMFTCKLMQSKEYPWYKCLIHFLWLLAMILCISPWLFRVWFFYAIEEEDRDMLISVLNNKGLRLPRPFPGSLVVYLTPTHTFFLLLYIFVAVLALWYSNCLHHDIKKSLKRTIRLALKRVQQTKFDSCRTFIAIMLFPLEICGIVGVIFLPFWLVILSLGLIILWVRMLPLVNLTLRLLINFFYTIYKCVGTGTENAVKQKNSEKEMDTENAEKQEKSKNETGTENAEKLKKSEEEKNTENAEKQKKSKKNKTGTENAVKRKKSKNETGTENAVKQKKSEEETDTENAEKQKNSEIETESYTENEEKTEESSKGWEILLRRFKSMSDKEDEYVKKKIVQNKNSVLKLCWEILSSGIRSMTGDADLSAKKKICLAVAKAFMCICVFLFYVLVVECTAFCVDVVVYVIIGIILNSKFVMKFLALAVIIALHTYDCFSSVGKTYEGFAKAVNSEIQDKVGEDLKKTAMQPEKIQQRQAFAVPALNVSIAEPMTLFAEDFANLKWKPKRLVLFLDKDDTPYLPSNFFYSTVNMGHSFCPKPVHRMYLMALIELVWISLFFGFVMLVVLAFGGALNISETNQTLATLASGLVPFAFRQLFKPRSAAKVDKDNVGWHAKLEHEINNHSSFWDIKDLDENDPKQDPQLQNELKIKGLSKDFLENVQIIIGDGSDNKIWIKKTPVVNESTTKWQKLRSGKVGCLV